MANQTWNHPTPLHLRLLCIFMAGLTACSTTGSQSSWREVSRRPGIPKSAQAGGIHAVGKASARAAPPADQNPPLGLGAEPQPRN